MPSAAKLQALSQQTAAVASEPSGSPSTEPGSGSEARPEEAQLLSLDLLPAFLDTATGQLPRMWRQLRREVPHIFEYFWSARRRGKEEKPQEAAKRRSRKKQQCAIWLSTSFFDGPRSIL